MTRKQIEKLIEDVKNSVLEMEEMHKSMINSKFWLLNRLQNELREIIEMEFSNNIKGNGKNND